VTAAPTAFDLVFLSQPDGAGAEERMGRLKGEGLGGGLFSEAGLYGQPVAPQSDHATLKPPVKIASTY